MLPRVEDVLDEAVELSEKSVYLLLVLEVALAPLALLFSDFRLATLPPILASSLFLIGMLSKLYSLAPEHAKRRLGLVLVAPSSTVLASAVLSLWGIFTHLACVLTAFGLSAILAVKLIAARREYTVVM